MSKNSLHLMIDLETLGLNPTAAIVGIGAVFFNPESGELGKTFDKFVTVQSNMELDRTITPSTLEWWLKQPSAVREKMFTKEAIHLSTAMQEFSKFVVGVTGGKEYRVWGNGATFDITIMEDAYRCVKRRPPWKYRNVRDVRTLVDLTSHLPRTPFEGVRHLALDDAVHQAKYVSERWQYIQNLVNPKTSDTSASTEEPATAPPSSQDSTDSLGKLLNDISGTSNKTGE
jgi:exodeoxyribonuclease VIII